MDRNISIYTVGILILMSINGDKRFLNFRFIFVEATMSARLQGEGQGDDGHGQT